jgi:UrcA family protein
MSHPLVRSSVALLFLMTIAQVAPGQAAKRPAERIKDVPVRYQDLDLRKDTDVQVLLGRIERAAWRACGGNHKFHLSYELRPRQTAEVFEECRRQAVERAVASIDAIRGMRAGG